MNEYGFIMNPVPGKQRLLPHMVSRAATVTPENDTSGGDDVVNHAVRFVTAFVSDVTFKRVVKGTDKNSYMHDIIRIVRPGATFEGELKPFDCELSVAVCVC